MAKKEKTKTFGEKTKEWWSSDTAKAVATIIAVLLIPVAVLAWNYSSSLNMQNEFENSILEGQSTVAADLYDGEIDVSDEEVEFKEYLESEPIELDSEPTQVIEEQPTEVDKKDNSESGFLRKLLLGSVVISGLSSDENADRKNSLSLDINADEIGSLFEDEDSTTVVENNDSEPAEEEEDPKMSIEDFLTGLTNSTDKTSEIVNEDEKSNDSNTNSIENVTSLPDTSSTKEYIVEQGDNIYSISLKLCGDESFYKNMMNSDYLKVGQSIEVECK